MSIDTRSPSGIARRREAARMAGDEHYVARRQEIIGVAAEVFREKGYDKASLNDIAAQMGTERASLYYYVASKEELFQEAVREVVETNLKAADRIMRRKDDAQAKLAALAEQVIVSYADNYPHTFVYIQEDMRRVTAGETEWARDMARQTKRIEAITIKLIRQGIDEGTFRDDLDPQLASNGLWGMLNWTHRWYKPGGKHAGEDVARTFSELFLGGLRKR